MAADIKHITKHFLKDFRVEFRNRFALNIALAFAGISTLAVSLVAGGISFSFKVQSILLWLIIFFSAMNGLSHIFVREEDERTALFLRLNSPVEVIYLSKLIFNIIFFTIILLVIVPLFIFLLRVSITHLPLFAASVFAGGLAISASTTILGAMVAKAGGKGSLFTIISFPILLPVLWVSISSTSASLDSTALPNYNNIIFLLAFSGMIIGISFLLFRFIWIEE
ncbi:MAG: heme ABC transporter permease CcmB [bacterium]|nr:heme ABC transporter permease CcmB [bacterium]